MIADIIIGIFLVYILAYFFVFVFMYQTGPSKFALDIRILKNTLKKSNVRRQFYKSLKIVAKDRFQLHNFNNNQGKTRC